MIASFPQAKPLLQTRGLCKHFGGVHAVREVNFEVTEGELRCLIGPNGAGKSTFFKMLTGQVRANAGDILFGGEKLQRLEPHEIARRGIGIKTQVPSVFDGLTVSENLWVAANRHQKGRAAEAAVNAQMERLRLTPIARRPVGQLAHGQRQWVELGVVLCANPTLLLLDEPAAGMTHDEVDRTAELVRSLSETCTLVVVEHDMRFIRNIATKITVFNQGAILTEGGVDAVLSDPRVNDVYLGKQAAA
jgi:branched-chain amino acid transport system ATP-binding protein